MIADICVDSDNRIYIVDQQLSRVSVYSGDGVFLHNIGREGDGPGEYRRPYRAFISPDGNVGVLSSSRGKVQMFDPSGGNLGLLSIPELASGVIPQLRDIRRSGDGYVALSVVRTNAELVLPGEREELRVVHRLDAAFQEQVRYFEQRLIGDESVPEWRENSFMLNGRWNVGVEGEVFVSTEFDKYSVAVYGRRGQRVATISRPYVRRERSRAEKQAIYDWATINPNGLLPGTTVHVEDYDQDVQGIYCRGDGTTWVLTSRGIFDRPRGTLGVFDVFSSDGRFQKRVALVGEGDPAMDQYYFVGERIYVVSCHKGALATMISGGQQNRFSERCAEPMQIICFRLPLGGPSPN